MVYLPQTLPAGVHLSVLESILVARRALSEHRSHSANGEVIDILRTTGNFTFSLCDILTNYPVDKTIGGACSITNSTTKVYYC